MGLLRSALLVAALLSAGCLGAAPVSHAPDAAAPQPTAPVPSATPASAVAPATTAGPVSAPWRQDGNSSATRLAACLPVGPGGCLGYHAEETGRFQAAQPVGNAVLVATWTPVTAAQATLLVTVVQDGQPLGNASGASPLTIQLGPLASGSYDVPVFFTGPVGAMVDQKVQWTVSGQA